MVTDKERVVDAMIEIDVGGINDEILDKMVEHARLMPEFDGIELGQLRKKLNHLAVPLAYREARIRKLIQ